MDLKLKFNSDGLIPAIAQDYKTGEVLMLAYIALKLRLFYNPEQ